MHRYITRLCEEYLYYLGIIINDAVEIRVRRAGKELNITTPLKPAAECKVYDSKRQWVGYELYKDLSLGIFYLDRCHHNETYKKTLRAFFTEVGKQKIENIAIDVRRNRGGTSQVIDTFMKYLDIDKYKWFGAEERYSITIRKQGIRSRKTGYRSVRGPT